MPQLSDFKAILFDVDKTLTNFQREIHPRTKTAIAALTAAGYKCGVCTGRSYVSLTIDKILDIFSPESFHIVNGGTQVVTEQGKILWEQILSKEIVADILEHAEKLQAGCVLKYSDGMFANEFGLNKYREVNPIVLSVLQPLPKEHDLACPTIAVVGASPEFKEYLFARTDITTKQMIFYNDQPLIDVTSKDIDKKRGMEEWAKLQNLQLTEIIGIGDSDNDIEFLNATGFAVAMGNATDTIKSISDRVIGHTNEDGLAIYLENILKGQPL